MASTHQDSKDLHIATLLEPFSYQNKFEPRVLRYHDEDKYENLYNELYYTLTRNYRDITEYDYNQVVAIMKRIESTKKCTRDDVDFINRINEYVEKKGIETSNSTYINSVILPELFKDKTISLVDLFKDAGFSKAFVHVEYQSFDDERWQVVFGRALIKLNARSNFQEFLPLVREMISRKSSPLHARAMINLACDFLKEFLKKAKTPDGELVKNNNILQAFIYTLLNRCIYAISDDEDIIEIMNFILQLLGSGDDTVSIETKFRVYRSFRDPLDDKFILSSIIDNERIRNRFNQFLQITAKIKEANQRNEKLMFRIEQCYAILRYNVGLSDLKRFWFEQKLLPQVKVFDTLAEVKCINRVDDKPLAPDGQLLSFDNTIKPTTSIDHHDNKQCACYCRCIKCWHTVCYYGSDF